MMMMMMARTGLAMIIDAMRALSWYIQTISPPPAQ